MNAVAETVHAAREALHSAIRAGKDTLIPRKELTEAEQAAAKEAALSAKILAQAESARRQAIQKREPASTCLSFAVSLTGA